MQPDALIVVFRVPGLLALNLLMMEPLRLALLAARYASGRSDMQDL